MAFSAEPGCEDRFMVGNGGRKGKSKAGNEMVFGCGGFRLESRCKGGLSRKGLVRPNWARRKLGPAENGLGQFERKNEE